MTDNQPDDEDRLIIPCSICGLDWDMDFEPCPCDCELNAGWERSGRAPIVALFENTRGTEP